MWSPRAIETLMQDVRYGGRVLLRNPGFTLVVALSLALGIGANTAIFSLLDAALLRLLPVEAPEQLFFLKKTGLGDKNQRFSYPSFERLRAALPASSGLAALGTIARLNAVYGDGLPEAAQGQMVSGEWFGLLGVRPAIGRALAAEDNRALGGHPVAVLSHGYWQRRFAGDPGVLGRTVKLNGAAFTIVGVAPPGFFGVSVGDAPDLWLPLMMQAEIRYAQNASNRDADLRRPWVPQEGIEWLSVMLRVGDPQSAPAVADRLNAVFRREVEERAAKATDPRERERQLRERIELEPGGKGQARLREQLSAPLAVLMAMVALVLLVACANIANLSLARAAARGQEMAVRLAIGAGRARLVRQLLTESLMLALAGGALGLLVARWGGNLLLRLASGDATPVALQLRLDYRVLGFGAALSIATGLAFGLWPALRATRLDLTAALKDNARAARGGSRPAFGRALVVGQVALSLVLLAGAALFARSLQNLARIDTGFDQGRVLTARLDPRAAGYSEEQLPGLYQRLLDRARALPGVRLASLSLYSLVSGSARTSSIHAAGRPHQPGEENSGQENYVGPDYFATVGMTLVRGRDFGPQDDEKSPKVAIVNESFVRRFFGDENPLGRRFGYGGPPEDAAYEVVGVVRDVKVNDLRERTPPMSYYPLRQHPAEYARSLDVRTVGDPRRVAAELRQALGEVDRNLPVREVITLAEQVDRTLTRERLVARLTGLFSLLALGLACLGLYGVMSYAVARRTGELGIRMALGATPRGVRWMVLREALLLVLIGVAAGLPLAVAAARLAAGLLYGLSPTDPATLTAAALIMLGVAGLAAYLPARRASRVDPMDALRYE